MESAPDPYHDAAPARARARAGGADPRAPPRGASITVCLRSHDLPDSNARVFAVANVEGLRRGQSRARVLVKGADQDLLLPRRAERVGRGPLRARRRTVLIASMATAGTWAKERQRLRA